MSALSSDVEKLASASSSSISIRRYSPNLGATVSGVNLNRDLSPGLASAIRNALLNHGVIFFRDQQLDPERLLQVARLFGEPLRHNPYIPSTETHAGVEVIESGSRNRLANESWHADVTWQRNPPKATVLYAVELPASGGDTVWTSTTGAYRSLHPLLTAYLETLIALNSVDANGYARQSGADERLDELREKYPPIDVPLIGVHPETREKYIFATELHTRYIKGLSRNTSESILRLCFGALENPELHARFVWQPGSLAVWDNRLVQHRAIHDYGQMRRVLNRVTLA
jgi:taurine dioxygenase